MTGAPPFFYLQIQQLRAKLTNEQRGNKEKRGKNERETVAASWRASGTTADGWPERVFYCKKQ